MFRIGQRRAVNNALRATTLRWSSHARPVHGLALPTLSTRHRPSATLSEALDVIECAPCVRTLDDLTKSNVPAFIKLDVPTTWLLSKGIETRTPIVHITPTRVLLLKALLEGPPHTFFPAGAQGAGKSTVTLLLACAAHSRGWPSLYIPSAEQFRTASRSPQPADAVARLFLTFLRDQHVADGSIPPYLQTWAASTGMSEWLKRTQSSVSDFETPLALLWPILRGECDRPFFIGIAEHNDIFEAALKLGYPSRQPLSDSILAPLVRPWTSVLSQHPFVNVFTGSSHSAFLGTIPFGEDSKIHFLPMMDKSELYELLEHPASHIRVGEVFLKNPTALLDVTSMIHELTGGNARHVHFTSRMTIDGEPAFAPKCLTQGHMVKFEKELRLVLEQHWEALALHAHACSLQSDVREKHMGTLLHFLQSPTAPISRAAARTFSDTFMDWGALTVKKTPDVSANPSVVFVSPIARSAVLRTWLRCAPLSHNRVHFEQEILRLFGSRFKGSTVVHAPKPGTQKNAAYAQAEFAPGSLLQLMKPFERMIELDVGGQLANSALSQSFAATLTTQVQHAINQDAVLYLRAGDSERFPGCDGFFFVPGEPPQLVCTQAAVGVDLSSRMKNFAAGHSVLLTLHKALWDIVTSQRLDYPVLHFSCAGNQSSGVPYALEAHSQADGGVPEQASRTTHAAAWPATFPIRIALLLGQKLSAVNTSCWVKKLPVNSPNKNVLIPIEILDRTVLEGALAVSIPDQFS